MTNENTIINQINKMIFDVNKYDKYDTTSNDK